MEIPAATLAWLLEGDPAVRWQVQRDLLNSPPEVYMLERQKVAETGMGAALLARQDADGHWGGGIYSPKYISTHYTLLLLRRLGLPQDNLQARAGCTLFLKKGLCQDGSIRLFNNPDHSDTCVTGMLLAMLSYFGDPDERIHIVSDHLLREQMPDGGWNCRRIRGDKHGSFHTTHSVLDGLAEYRRAHPQNAERTLAASERGHEFLLQHHLYRSHRTGEVANPAFTRMVFPPHWHYDFMCALEYFQSIDLARDERMLDAIDLLQQKQAADGRWLYERPYSGKTFFQLEKVGKPSRWNTLRALRVLRWWQGNPG